MIQELIRKNSFSGILASAVVEFIPGVQIAQAGLMHHGFYCDFYFYSPLSPDLLVFLEERMRQIIREDREIRSSEMVPFSASELFRSLGLRERSKQALNADGLVRVVRIGKFADLSEEEGQLSSTGGAGFFRLLTQTEIGSGVLRVFGVCSGSKKDLKDLLSKWGKFKERNHESAGVGRGLWREIGEDRRLWLSKGLEVRGYLASFWQNAFAPVAQRVEGGVGVLEFLAETVPSSMEIRVLDGGRGARGLLDSSNSLALIINHFLDLCSFCTSFLQTIHKSLTILGFTFRIRCIGLRRKGCPLRTSLDGLGWNVQEVPAEGVLRLEFLAEDALGCDWVLAEISEQKLKGLRGIQGIVWVERNLALLLEKNDGSLPFWLAPEHLRILSVSEKQELSALKELEYFREQGVRVFCDKAGKRTLSERIHEAEEARVPFVVILGEKEIKKSFLTWREWGKGKQETGSREQLKRLLIENK